jgi:hypothetical protein
MVEERMKRRYVLFVLLLIMITSSVAVPYTTIGHLRVPNAYLLPHKSAEFTYVSYLRRVKNDFEELPDYEYIPCGLINIGLFDRVGIAGWAGDDLGFVNLKLKLLEETASIPQVAIGIENLFSKVKQNSVDIPYAEYPNPDKGFYEKNSPYIVFSKGSVIRGMTGISLLETVFSIGVGGAKFKGQDDIARRFEGFFGSITIKPEKNTYLTIENDGFNINLGAEYYYKNFGFKISYVGLEEQENNRIGIALSYLFDKYADKRRKEISIPGEPMTSREFELLESELTGKEIDVSQDLLEELKKLREQREHAQKVLDELRKQLKEMDEETKRD